jgi:RimJ/RimL family protein N-acetyltransferase
MLKGEVVRLRTVRETDLERLYVFHQDIANRGNYFPIGVMSEPVFKRTFHETGFWQNEEGMLLIVGVTDDILGHIEFYPTVGYLDELELSYQVYSQEHHGQGITTDAVRLMTGYLFDRKKHNRIRLVIHPDNMGSKRVAEKCGYTYEGIARGAWFHRGRSQDVAIYAIVREDHYQST